MTYVTTLVKFEKLVKKLGRLFRKLDEINAKYTFNIEETFTREVPIYANDEINKVTYDTKKTAIVDCVRFTLDFDKYVVGDYRVGAVVERSADENLNLVYTVDDTVDFADYAKTNLRCEHCNKNYNRKKVVVLVDNETGTHKMVGTACLKDFIGYEVASFAGYFDDIHSILAENEEPYIYENTLGAYKVYIDTREYLAYCINIIEAKGYSKTVKTDALYNLNKKVEINETDYETADKVIEFFKTYETRDIFEVDTKAIVTGLKPVSYENGYIAYAYELYKKIIKKIEAAKEAAEAAAKSDYYGKIGDKIDITGKINRAGHYETQFGTVVIFKIIDADGNIFVWKTTTYIDIENDSFVNVRGTIKDHNEFRNEKQTVLTRCKITECVPA